MTNLTGDGWFVVPGARAKPADVRQIAYLTCAFQHVGDLAKVLSVRMVAVDLTGQPLQGGPPPVKATPEAVARAYAQKVGGQEAVYEGCLEALRNQT